MRRVGCEKVKSVTQVFHGSVLFSLTLASNKRAAAKVDHAMAAVASTAPTTGNVLRRRTTERPAKAMTGSRPYPSTEHVMVNSRPCGHGTRNRHTHTRVRDTDTRRAGYTKEGTLAWRRLTIMCSPRHPNTLNP